MKGLLLKAEWDPRPSYEVSDWEKRTGKAVEGSTSGGIRRWRSPKYRTRSPARERR